MMLPNFLIIGAQKAATSWLAACLGEHPDIFMVEEKEIYFFNVYYERGLEWYEPFFNNWSGQTMIGEATPGYISHPDAPSRIRSTLGEEVKLIASLRHPVERAYSAYWHYLRNGKLSPDTDFLTLFQEDDQFDIRSRGYYFSQLCPYLECFPRDKLLILIYEEIFKNSQQTINNCLEFLNVNPQFTPNLLNSKVHAGGKDIGSFHSQAQTLRIKSRKALERVAGTNILPQRMQKQFFAAGRRLFHNMAFKWGSKKKSFERLDKNLHQELLKYYMSDIRQLEELLDRDLSVWYKI